MDADEEATLHRRNFGQSDRMTTTGTVKNLVRQFNALPESKKSEYSIMIGSMEYGPNEIENLVRELEIDT